MPRESAGGAAPAAPRAPGGLEIVIWAYLGPMEGAHSPGGAPRALSRGM